MSKRVFSRRQSLLVDAGGEDDHQLEVDVLPVDWGDQLGRGSGAAADGVPDPGAVTVPLEVSPADGAWDDLDDVVWPDELGTAEATTQGGATAVEDAGDWPYATERAEGGAPFTVGVDEEPETKNSADGEDALTTDPAAVPGDEPRNATGDEDAMSSNAAAEVAAEQALPNDQDPDASSPIQPDSDRTDTPDASDMSDADDAVIGEDAVGADDAVAEDAVVADDAVGEESLRDGAAAEDAVDADAVGADDAIADDAVAEDVVVAEESVVGDDAVTEVGVGGAVVEDAGGEESVVGDDAVTEVGVGGPVVEDSVVGADKDVDVAVPAATVSAADDPGGPPAAAGDLASDAAGEPASKSEAKAPRRRWWRRRREAAVEVAPVEVAPVEAVVEDAPIVVSTDEAAAEDAPVAAATEDAAVEDEALVVVSEETAIEKPATAVAQVALVPDVIAHGPVTRRGVTPALTVPARSLVIPVPSGLTATSAVMATIQTNSGYVAVRAAVPNAVSGTVTVFFTGAAPIGTKVAWFLLD
ncbi:MAG: hypothetical protein JWM05_2542 [Acidimicrobiales bacterium]|nr:hypothetical protein [Acidimicrobiales bacterium]